MTVVMKNAKLVMHCILHFVKYRCKHLHQFCFFQRLHILINISLLRWPTECFSYWTLQTFIPDAFQLRGFAFFLLFFLLCDLFCNIFTSFKFGKGKNILCFMVSPSQTQYNLLHGDIEAISYICGRCEIL